MTGDGRERFLKAIAERIAPDRVEEVHLFPAIRHGGKETGVAVITIRPEAPASEAEETAPAALNESTIEGDTLAASEPAAQRDASPGDDSSRDALLAGDLAEEEAAEHGDGDEAAEQLFPQRFTVLRAHYRLVLKGPERGKWEVGITEEADAPASTVQEVVRGVHERAGGTVASGDDEPERLTGEAFRAALIEEPWTTKR
jgi:hypothetical protein